MRAMAVLAFALVTGCVSEPDVDHEVAETTSELTLVQCMSTYYVQAGAAGNGTSTSPLGTIRAALDAAASCGNSYVTVVVRAGTYNEGVLDVRCDTTIDGAGRYDVFVRGSFRNLTSAHLRIDDVTIEDSPSPGGVYVSHASASTEIYNARIRRANRYGIFHYDGTLIMQNVRVDQTIPSSGSYLYGTGLYALGGARVALLDLVDFYKNGSGIVVSGSGTRIWITDTAIWDSTGNASFASSVGSVPASSGHYGILVKSSARLSGRELTMWNNRGFGVVVTGNSLAHVRDSNVQTTRMVSGAGGFGVLTESGGVLDIGDFSSSYNELVGLRINDASVTASHGAIRSNQIGISVSQSRQSLVNCFHYVEVTGNGRDLDYGVLPIPGYGYGDSSSTACATVSW